MTTPLRVRFAPSPTGPLHIGGARTALYNYLHARSKGGAFVLRIDDTDRERSTAESLAHILEGLRWLGLDWDEGPEKDGPHGPYFQSLRLEGYRDRVDRLLESGKAYRCFCSPEEVQEGRLRMQERVGASMYDRRCRRLEDREIRCRMEEGRPYVVRFAMPESGTIVLKDAIKGEVEIRLDQIDDWVMLRRDGSPLYNLCSALDDADMEITDVIRGEEHLLNTVKQVFLLEALGLPVPRFAHLPLILGKDGKKLSKRMAQTDLLSYRDAGYPAEALVNFFARLGWAPDAETEVFGLEEAIDRFDLKDVGRSGSMLDEEKLEWLVGVWLRRMEPGEILDRAVPWIEKAGLASSSEIAARRAWFEAIVGCYRERVRSLAEVPEKIGFFLAAEIRYDDKAWKNLTKHAEAAEWMEAWLNRLGAVWDSAEALEARSREIAEELGIGFGRLVHPLRAALTGTSAGAGLFDIVFLLGPEETRKRVEAAVHALREGVRP